MAPRRVALLSIDPWVGPAESFRPFNYSIRKIHAALVGTALPIEADVRVFDFYTSSARDVVAAVEAFDPDVIGASIYVWSLPTFLEAARLFKAHRPDRAIIFGGPSARPAMLSLAPWSSSSEVVDALVLGEGEDAIREIVSLPVVDRSALRTVPGIAVSTDGRWEFTPERPRRLDVDALSSPYALGLVPRGVTAHLETFRGCPLSCTFCEWGVLGSEGSVFSEEYLRNELLAFRTNRTLGAFSIDAALNLNSRAFRNLKAAEAATGVLRDLDFHCEVYPSHANDEQLEFLSHITKAEVGIGLQSIEPEVLARLERPFDPKRFDQVVRRIARVCTATILIIMGLPGDDPRSFRKTFEQARSYGCNVHVYHCLVLPDALMTRAPADFDMTFDPVTLKMYSCLGWSAEDFKREWDYLGEIVAREGGEIIPMYYARFHERGKGPERRRPNERGTYARPGEESIGPEAGERFGGFAASGLIARQRDVAYSTTTDAGLVTLRAGRTES